MDLQVKGVAVLAVDAKIVDVAMAVEAIDQRLAQLPLPRTLCSVDPVLHSSQRRVVFE